MANPSCAVVFGATGFVGRELVRQLCVRATVRPIAHVRPDSTKLAEWQARFGELDAEVDTTPWQVEPLAAMLATRRPSQLYIVIGTTRGRAKADGVDGDIYERIDLGLTAMIVDAACKAALGATRVVYLSSIGADPAARSAYLRARGKAEAAVRDSGLSWVIARPSFIVGDRDERRIGERAAAVVGDGVLAVARVFGGSGLRARYRSTTPDVLAAALIRLGESAEPNRTYDGSDLR